MMLSRDIVVHDILSFADAEALAWLRQCNMDWLAAAATKHLHRRLQTALAAASLPLQNMHQSNNIQQQQQEPFFTAFICKNASNVDG